MVKFYLPNLCTLQIKITTIRIFQIHNIYNPTIASKKPSKIPLLQTILENSLIDKQMVLGDFYLHHSYWGSPSCRNDFLASNLVILAEQYHLAQLVSTGIIIYSKSFRKSTIDLFFAMSVIGESLWTCMIPNNLDHHSDHMPIVITISLVIIKVQLMSRRN